MMAFYEDFPSLRDKIIFLEQGKDENGNNIYGGEYVFIRVIQKDCLDKQKVRGAITKLKKRGCDEGCGCSFFDSIEDLERELGL
jgi:hypothetical protein